MWRTSESHPSSLPVQPKLIVPSERIHFLIGSNYVMFPLIVFLFFFSFTDLRAIRFISRHPTRKRQRAFRWESGEIWVASEAKSVMKVFAKMKRARMIAKLFFFCRESGFVLKSCRDEITSLRISIFVVLFPDGLSNLHHRECSLATFRYTADEFFF